MRGDVDFPREGCGGGGGSDLECDSCDDLCVSDGGEGGSVGVEGEDGGLEIGGACDVVWAGVWSGVCFCEFGQVGYWIQGLECFKRFFHICCIVLYSILFGVNEYGIS